MSDVVVKKSITNFSLIDIALLTIDPAFDTPVQNSLNVLGLGGDVVIALATDRIPNNTNSMRIVADLQLEFADEKRVGNNVVERNIKALGACSSTPFRASEVLGTAHNDR